MFRTLGLIFIAALSASTSGSITAAADPVGTSAAVERAVALAEQLGMSQSSIERVRNGEIVAQDLPPASDKDLSIAVITRVNASLENVRQLIEGDRFAKVSTVTIARGEIDPQSPSLAPMELDAASLEELAKDPGGLFFMSGDEAERIARAGEQGTAQALEAYRSVLAERARAYWEQGIAGITPYAGSDRSPRTDLGHANDAARELIRNPEIRSLLDAIPAKSQGEATHQLFWALQKARDQAAPVLIHRIAYSGAEGELFVERRFYSAYDYDSLQIVTGVLPVSDASCVAFYTNHTFTSQVTGFGGGAKRSIGRKMLRNGIVAEMERARNVAEGH